MRWIVALALMLEVPRAVWCQPAAADAAAPTWARDVAAILHARCAGCHRDGGSAPFSLTGYDQAARASDRRRRTAE